MVLVWLLPNTLRQLYGAFQCLCSSQQARTKLAKLLNVSEDELVRHAQRHYRDQTESVCINALEFGTALVSRMTEANGKWTTAKKWINWIVSAVSLMQTATVSACASPVLMLCSVTTPVPDNVDDDMIYIAAHYGNS